MKRGKPLKLMVDGVRLRVVSHSCSTITWRGGRWFVMADPLPRPWKANKHRRAR